MLNTKIIKPAFFYIIEFDGQIHEIKYSDIGFENAFKLWKSKGILTFTGLKGIAGANVKKVILGGDDYLNYISMAKPNQYILNGYIKDGKTGDVIRVLDWKQKELDAIKKLEAKDDKPMTDEERELAKQKMAKIFGNKFKNKIIKKIDE